MSSTPSLTKFNPHDVTYQYKVIEDVRSNFDYSLGAHEILLSGAVGSAKSILMAHIIVTHCLMYDRARAGIGRHALPDLKATLFTKIKEHIQEDLIEGKDYKCNDSTGYIRFSNGSEIISRSWADKNFRKTRSLELSLMAFEELTEHDDNEHAYTELSMRVNRLPHVPEQLIISATNPDSPSHWAYKHFMLTPSNTRHVYYSVTTDNKFLPPSYIKKLLEDLDPKLIDRMIYGKWIDILGETIYHQYSSEINFIQRDYEVVTGYPVYISFDFNVALGKPMSLCLFQYINDTFHFFDEIILESGNTESIMTEAVESGRFNIPCTKFCIAGDATGKSKSPSSNKNNYEIIYEILSFHRIKYENCVLPTNPPIKARHNIVNAYCKNHEKRVRLYVYKKAKTLDEGFRLVKLKKGGNYIEDDSKRYQHVTTAAGYGIYYCNLLKKQSQYKSSTIQL